MKPKRKLRLDAETLRVEAFSVAEAPEPRRGTVEGYESSLGGDCASHSWSGPNVCFCCGGETMETACCWTDPLYC